MQQRVLLLGVLALFLTACSGTASNEPSSTSAAPQTTREESTAPPPTSTSQPPATTDDPDQAEPDPAQVAAVCEALGTLRMNGRHEALDDWRISYTVVPFAERIGPIEEACGELVRNHAASRSLALRTADIRTGTKSPLGSCKTDGTVSNRMENVTPTVPIHAVAVARAWDNDVLVDFHYVYLDDVQVGEIRELAFEWDSVSGGSYGCEIRYHGWLVDDTDVTATVHEMGDAADSELPAGAPPLETASDDWITVLNSLFQFDFWRGANPDAETIEETVDVRSAAFAEEVESTDDDAGQGLATVTSGFEVLSIERVTEIATNIVAIEFAMGPGSVYDTIGEVESDPTEIDPQQRWAVLRRSEYDGRWRWLVPSIRSEGGF